MNVRVVYTRLKGDLGRLEGVVDWEVDVQVEHTPSVWAVGLEVDRGKYGTKDLGDPVQLVAVSDGPGGAVCGRILLYVQELLQIAEGFCLS